MLAGAADLDRLAQAHCYHKTANGQAHIANLPCNVPNPSAAQALGREAELLKQHCQEVVGDAHFRAPNRRATAAARLAVRLLRGFL